MSALDRVLALSRGEAEAAEDLDELTLTWSPEARAAALKARKAKTSELKQGDVIGWGGKLHVVTGPSSKESYHSNHMFRGRELVKDPHTAAGWRTGNGNNISTPPDREWNVHHNIGDYTKSRDPSVIGLLDAHKAGKLPEDEKPKPAANKELMDAIRTTQDESHSSPGKKRGADLGAVAFKLKIDKSKARSMVEDHVANGHLENHATSPNKFDIRVPDYKPKKIPGW